MAIPSIDVIVSAIVFNGGAENGLEQFILVRCGALWQLPTAKLEVGIETLEDTFQRAVQEFTGMDCVALGPVDLQSKPDSDGHCIRVSYQGRVKSFTAAQMNREKCKDMEIASVEDYFTGKWNGKIIPRHKLSLDCCLVRG